MKNRRLIAMLLASTMVFSLSGIAFAAETEVEESNTVGNWDAEYDDEST